MGEKNEEINEIEKEMQAIIDEKESEIFELRVALEEKKQNSGEAEEANKDTEGIEEANRQMELLIAANEALKTKMEDLMRIVEKEKENPLSEHSVAVKQVPFLLTPVKPVVPLCDVHPEFGKVTTLNRENTKTSKIKLLEQNLPPKYLLENYLYNFSSLIPLLWF